MLQVLCSNSVLDSSEYWLRNEKALCRLGLLDSDSEGSCTVVSSITRAQQRWTKSSLVWSGKAAGGVFVGLK